MKYLFSTSFIIFFSFGLMAQKSQSNKVLKLLDTYKQDSLPETLDLAYKLVDEIFEEESAYSDPLALYAKSQTLAHQILTPNYEEPDDVKLFLEDVHETYKSALFHDTRGKYRYNILLSLYKIKAKMSALGAEKYVEEDFKSAINFYRLSTQLNDVEREFPRVPAIDTTIFVTAAVTANLAGEDEEAIRLYERVLEMEFYREDIFNQLIALYKKNQFEVKAKKTKIEKLKIFPEKDN